MTTAYTYTASASIISHVGAKTVLVDCDDNVNSFEMDYNLLEASITKNTKVIIAVDIAGIMCDYDRIFEIVEKKKALFCPNNEIQKAYNRIVVLSDSAHSLGATYKDKRAGSVADFSVFSFHAVKNLTTAEGGAVVWKNHKLIDNEYIYKTLKLFSLHGQTINAYQKQKGNVDYDIVGTYYKANMTDIASAIGVSQLSRYNKILNRRHDIIKRYDNFLNEDYIYKISHFDNDRISSGHLYMVRIKNFNRDQTNQIMEQLWQQGIATNIHYKPLPMLTAYKSLGFKIEDFQNAYRKYENEISLPVSTKLTNRQIDYIIKNFNKIVKNFCATNSQETAIEISELNEIEYINEIVKLHKNEFKDFFLSSLIDGFLKLYYTSILEDKDSKIIIAKKRNKIVGFLTYSQNINRVYKNIIKKHFFKLLGISFKQLLISPKKIVGLLKRLIQSNSQAIKDNEIYISSMAVNQKYQNCGVGESIIYALKNIDEIKNFNLVLHTDKNNNEKSIEFFKKNNFIVENTFVFANNREMLKMIYKRIME